jgi:actin-related protein 10
MYFIIIMARKVPTDLRKTLASSILVTGGTAMLPGFIPRLYTEIIRTLSTYPVSKHAVKTKRALPLYDKYSSLRPLLPYLAIINDPNPPAVPTSDRAKSNAGKAPAFVPALMAWVGGSLAGALKTGGHELAREKWDEMGEQNRADEAMEVNEDGSEGVVTTPQKPRSILPDWTKSTLLPGAPPANVHPV